MATQSSLSISGEYYLQGVRETASGFLLKPDGTFQFFFTNGALDRYGSGKWTVKDDLLILNSATRPEFDFALLNSKAIANDFISVRLKDNNPALLRYVYCSLQNGMEGSWQPLNEKGEIKFPKQKVETISLIFEFCSERFSIIPIKDHTHNDFEFRFEPWIVEFFFKDFTLQIKEDGFFGKHPLLGEKDYDYMRQ